MMYNILLCQYTYYYFVFWNNYYYTTETTWNIPSFYIKVVKSYLHRNNSSNREIWIQVNNIRFSFFGQYAVESHVKLLYFSIMVKKKTEIHTHIYKLQGFPVFSLLFNDWVTYNIRENVIILLYYITAAGSSAAFQVFDFF